jgi:hypothetical protein
VLAVSIRMPASAIFEPQVVRPFQANGTVQAFRQRNTHGQRQARPLGRCERQPE